MTIIVGKQRKRPIYVPFNADVYCDQGRYDSPGSGAWAAIRYNGQIYYARSHSIVTHFLKRKIGHKKFDDSKRLKFGYFHTKKSRSVTFAGKGGWESKYD